MLSKLKEKYKDNQELLDELSSNEQDILLEITNYKNELDKEKAKNAQLYSLVTGAKPIEKPKEEIIFKDIKEFKF